MKKLLWVPALALSLSFSQASFSGNEMMKGGMYMTCMQDMIKQVNLTAEQKSKVNVMKDKFKAMVSAKMQEMKSIRSQMKELIRTDNPMDEAKLDMLVSQRK